MQVESIATIFQGFSKQQVNLSLFISYWYWENWGLTNLPDQDGKSTSDMNLILSPYESYYGANRDRCNHFWVTFRATSKFITACVGLILQKVRIAGFSELRRETDVRYEFDFKVIFKKLGC